jgi:hypothetical protein
VNVESDATRDEHAVRSALLTAAWSGEPVHHRGQHDTIDGVHFLPPAGYDIALGLPISVDPLPYVNAGATWWLPEFPPEVLSLDTVRRVLRDGPLAP